MRKTALLFAILLSGGGTLAGAEEILLPEEEVALPVAAELQPGDAELFGVESAKGVNLSQLPETAVAPVVEINGLVDPPRRWHTVTRLNVKATADDNLFISSRDEVADVYFSAIPELTAGWGDFRREFTGMMGLPSRFRTLPEGSDARNYLFATYAPEAVLFLENSDENTLNHDLAVRGAYAQGRWKMTASVRLRKLSDPDIEFGTRTDRVVTTAGVNVRYLVSDKTSFEADFAARHQAYREGVDSTDLLGRLFMDYRAGAKTTVSLGGGLGYLAVDGGGDQSYEQALARVRYPWSDKLSFGLTGGVEFRQAVSGESSTVNPVFELNGNWTVTDRTSFSLAAVRRVESATLTSGRTVERSTFEARARQQVFQRIYVDLNGGFSRLDFEEASDASSLDRSDSLFFLGLAVAAEINQHLSARIAYRLENNDSTTDERSFTRNVTELQLGYQF